MKKNSCQQAAFILKPNFSLHTDPAEFGPARPPSLHELILNMNPCTNTQSGSCFRRQSGLLGIDVTSGSEEPEKGRRKHGLCVRLFLCVGGMTC